MKVDVKTDKKTVRGHELVPGKVYVSASANNVVVIMTGRKGVVENERMALVVKNPTSEASVGSLIAVTEISTWIEAEATLSILI